MLWSQNENAKYFNVFKYVSNFVCFAPIHFVDLFKKLNISFIVLFFCSTNKTMLLVQERCLLFGV